MPRKKKIRKCRICGVTEDKARISRRRLCEECGYARQMAAITAMREGKGLIYRRWKRAWLDGVQAYLNPEGE